jgi:hypothetical protein
LFLCLVVLALCLTWRMPWPLSLLLLVFVPFAPRAAKSWERGADRAIDPYVKGFRGERDVADALRTLGDDCYLVHDVDLGRGNVDHVVVAPSGIYTIETKAYEGKVRTDADRLIHNGFEHKKELRQAFAEAMAVRDFLGRVSGGQEHYVTPLLVFTKAKVDSKGKCAGVFVMRADRLAGFLQKGAPRLDPLQRSRIAAALGTRVSERAAAK